ncbi:MAG: amidohydrolase family protein [Gemmatimonas sp.]
MCVLCDSGESLADTVRRYGFPPPPPLSRRRLIMSAGVMAGGMAAQGLTGGALAQGAAAADPELARVQAQRRILLKGGIVLSLDPQVGDFAEGDVLIEDGRIREVRPGISASPETTAIVDATHRIIIPGFVDTHSHSYQGLLRGTLPNGRVQPEYDRDIQNNITLHYQPEDAYAGVLITVLAMLDMGTTGVVDISQANHSPEHSDAMIQALRDAGIRAVFAYSRGAGPKAQYPQDIARLLKTHFNSPDQLLTPAMATSLDPKSFLAAREAGVRGVLHIRLNSNALIELAKAGVLRDGDEFIHCTHLNDEAWTVIRDHGARTSHSPPLEMAMGHGYPAIQDALDHGVRPSLSCDHAATVGMDMFGMMRTAFNLQRLAAQQRTMKKEDGVPPLLTCREVLEFATINGARCAALDGRIGTLTPGKEADIVMLKGDEISVWPLNNAPSAVVNLMNPSHVENVFVAGKVRKWRGRLVGVDVARVLKTVADSRDAVLKRANFTVGMVE